MRSAITAALCLLLLPAAGCARLFVPPPLAARAETAAFDNGGYLGWTSPRFLVVNGSTLGGVALERGTRIAVVSPDGLEYATACTARRSLPRPVTHAGRTWTVPAAPEVICVVKRDDAEVAQLELWMRDDLRQVGRLAAFGNIVEFGATGRIREGSAPPWRSTHAVEAVYGYEFELQGRPVGAVELLRPGTLYVDREVSDEARRAVALTATLLQSLHRAGLLQ